MKLSSHFLLKEFTRSDTAVRLGIQNEPGETEVLNLALLCNRVLEPLRGKHGRPLTINSGYRCQALNKAVGGASTSQHTKGEAADVYSPQPRQLLADLLSLEIDFDQAILYPTFVHVSYRAGSNRRQVLYAKGVQP